jgi:broad specificity phosphatase PhoE
MTEPDGNPAGRSPTRLLLIRHGESTWNAEGRWQGHADPPLSVTGTGQARAAAAALTRVTAVWCSDLARAHQTAQLCAPAGLEVQTDRRLRERDVGAWTGLTRDAIEGRYPGWVADGRRPDGWEDDEAVARRAVPALLTIAADLERGAHAVVVSHGGLIRAVTAGLGGTPRPVPNLGGLWLLEAPGTLRLGEPVVLVDGARTAPSASASPGAPLESRP